MKMLQHKFVEFIPNQIEQGILYISIEYCTAVHNCVCGCGNEVVTPLSPTDWKLTFDGKTVSLYPSIGNWSFKCQSHYWIKNSDVEFAIRWTAKEIKHCRENDSEYKKMFYKESKERSMENSIIQEKVKINFWRKFCKLIGL